MPSWATEQYREDLSHAYLEMDDYSFSAGLPERDGTEFDAACRFVTRDNDELVSSTASGSHAATSHGDACAQPCGSGCLHRTTHDDGPGGRPGFGP